MSRAFVEVALPLPLDRTFTYSVEGSPPPAGTRVLVPFRRTERIGWIVSGKDDPVPPRVASSRDSAHAAAGAAARPAAPRIRPVLAVLDAEPSVPPELLRMARWIAEYYVAPLGIVLRSALPAVLSDASRDYLFLASAGEDDGTGKEGGAGAEAGAEGGANDGAGAAAGPGARTDSGAGADAGAFRPDVTPRAARLLEELAASKGPRRVAGLRRSLRMGSIWPEIRALEAAGLIRHEALPPRPPPVRTRKVVELVDWLPSLEARERLFGRAPRQRECHAVLEAAGGSAELAHLTGGHGFGYAVVKALVEKGVARLSDEELVRDPFADTPVPDAPAHAPNADQKAALDALVPALDEERPRPFLLHGITGSGKTLVYIELLEAVLARGRTAIVLVPEIALTPQTVSRFRARFGDRVAVLHSALSDGERHDAWRQLHAGEKRIAVGARSAIFAPLPDLGAIVVDEEHDGSYKQSEAPRYHARDVAVVRASLAGAVCVLGSATPALESWANATSGKFGRLSLPDRATGGRLPPVRTIDLRTQGRGGAGAEAVRGEGGTILSPPLIEAVRARLERKEQVILLLNRRGYSSFVQCRECGDVRSCGHCSISLTFHRVRGRLLCHHCRHEEPVPERCLRCGSTDLSYRGIGTEQVERSVAETFSDARIARMDVDTTSGKWAHHEILGRVERGEVDILLGTQMIAKGLDFPRVTLVGVVNADVGIHLPDFRASERAFQLLAQVAGRTGRGALGGEVLIQTSIPEHYAIRAALTHDYAGFAKRELEERTSPAYPPHRRLVNVIVSSPDPEVAAGAAEEGARWLRDRLSRRGAPPVELVGPAPSPIERLHGRWRWHFLLRAASPGALGELTHAFAAGFRPKGAADVRIAIDRDPVALL